MKKIVWLLLLLLTIPSAAAAYEMYISAPDTLSVGKPLVVTGNTTLGIGMPIDVVLSYQLTTTTEVNRTIAYIRPDKTFRAVFDTTGLPTGTYKVEVPTSGMGSSAVTMRAVQLVDRLDEIRISSPLIQPFSGILLVAGTLAGETISGVQVEVVGPENTVIFGPRYIYTNNLGGFSLEIPVSTTGLYEVSFTDAQGYIGQKTFTVGRTPATVETTGNVPVPTVYESIAPPLLPETTPQSSPLLPLSGLLATAIALFVIRK